MAQTASSGPRVFVVMATFEGERHIDAQIESLLAQSYPGFRLLVRDDGSRDHTPERLANWAARDARIELVADAHGHIGARGNFSLLLELALERGADLVAIADQDDVWLPHKLAVQLAGVERLEVQAEAPLLLHADLRVVGKNLDEIHPSLHRFMGLRHQTLNPLATLLIQNFVTGCSCLLNRALLQIALPIPADVVMYDWWLALCAAAAGLIAFDERPGVLYRQHASNQVGAKGYWGSIIGLAGRTLALRRRSFDEVIGTVRQARALESRLAARIDDGVPGAAHRDRLVHAHALVARYIALYDTGVGRIQRVRGMHRLGVRRQDLIRDISLKIKLLTTPIDVHRSDSR